MSDKDKIEQRKLLDEALKESFKKMLDIKKKLGQDVVTADNNGKPVVLTVDEVEKIIQDDKPR